MYDRETPTGKSETGDVRGSGLGKADAQAEKTQSFWKKDKPNGQMDKQSEDEQEIEDDKEIQVAGKQRDGHGKGKKGVNGQYGEGDDGKEDKDLGGEKVDDLMPTRLLNDAIQETEADNIDYATNEFSSYHRTQAPRKFNNEPVVRQLGNSEESLDEELDFSEENGDEEFDAPVLLSILNEFIQSKKGY